MSLTTTEIAQLLEEIAPALRGGWIQKIYQPTARTLVFEIRVPGRTHRLLVSCQAETARLHLLTRPFSNPHSPPAFCQFLRAHCQGAHIDSIRQIPNDRIVEWHLTSHKGARILICELTGRTANLLVLDAQGLVLRHLNGDRKRIGQLYRLPGERESVQPSNKTTRFASSSGNFPISAAIETHYQDRETTLAANTARESRLRALKKAVKKDRRRIDAWRSDLAGAAKYEAYGRYGELLKANVGSIKKGTDRIVVIDYFDESMPEVTIPLDAAKSAQGNLDDYFRKYRKYLTTERELRPRIEQAEEELDRFHQELAAIEQGTWVAPACLEVTAPRKTGREKGRRNELHGPFRRFTSADGLQIFVGRNARENDDLTFGLAKSDDLWLHARGTPGSHVVVRLEKGKEPPPETLREAASLALLYSGLKKSGKGEVIYTRRKWVKKAKGQAQGAVIVTRDQSLHITLDKARLVSLNERSQPKI